MTVALVNNKSVRGTLSAIISMTSGDPLSLVVKYRPAQVERHYFEYSIQKPFGRIPRLVKTQVFYAQFNLLVHVCLLGFCILEFDLAVDYAAL